MRSDETAEKAGREGAKAVTDEANKRQAAAETFIFYYLGIR
jgi:hypothetical protein